MSANLSSQRLDTSVKENTAGVPGSGRLSQLDNDGSLILESIHVISTRSKLGGLESWKCRRRCASSYQERQLLQF